MHVRILARNPFEAATNGALLPLIVGVADEDEPVLAPIEVGRSLPLTMLLEERTVSSQPG